MISKKDFVWTIGFQGNTAIVNKRERSAHRNLEPRKLLEEGLLRAAFCSALWDAEVESRPAAMDTFRDDFATVTGLKLSIEDIKRMLGVYQVPRDAMNVLAV